MTAIRLEGFDTSVLLGYLGALGLYRTVAMQSDGGTTLRFDRDGTPVIESELLTSGEELAAWVWSRYQPSPIASPWNSGAGFGGSSKKVRCTDGEKRDGVQLVMAATDSRLSTYQSTLKLEQELVRALGYDRDIGKEAFLRALRGCLPDAALFWLDAVAVVEGDEARYLSLLGTGGNDSRLDLSNNFMLRFLSLLPVAGNLLTLPKTWQGRSHALLAACLFDSWTEGLEEDSAGQFAPASREAPNGSSGARSIQAKKLSNPWAFVWAMEGTLWFAGAATRRLASHGRPTAAFPFHAQRVGSGFATASRAEKGKDELWVPLWGTAAGYHDIRTLFGEARAQVGRRRATSGLDYARAAASLGTLRGLSGFRRFSILERAGQSSIAVNVGHHALGESKRVDRLRVLDSWTRHYQVLSELKTAPPRLGKAWVRYERCVFDLTRRADARSMARVVAALGALERELAVRPELVSGSGALRRLDPVRIPQRSRLEWLLDSYDGTPEIRIALSLTGLHSRTPFAPLRHYLEADWRRERGAGRVREAPSLTGTQLLVEILRRRFVEAAGTGAHQRGQIAGPCEGFSVCHLGDVEALLSGHVDEERLRDLIWGLAPFAGVSLREVSRLVQVRSDAAAVIPGAFAVLRCAVSTSLPQMKEAQTITPRRAIPELLLSGRIDRALVWAERELRARRLHPFYFRRAPRPDAATRRAWAAALLIPLAPMDQRRLAKLALRVPNQKESPEEEVQA